ncbi:delta(9)-fatty-acid desaturase fat-7-like isoform X1 [Cimex lectularius]|uniref:Fatty acid desaturase n=1 Tax=Cimex lectularius TaxID=79782 RepID=A0A8I6TIQ0_CIMLE|nr:delta(9)-fatty-acid desaturase fat-7-like isoform X1 [Cimex lectularius]
MESRKEKIQNVELVKPPIKDDFPLQYVWLNVFAYTVLHLFFFYGLYLMLTFQAKWQTFIYTYLCIIFSIEGVTMGAHRLFSHKSYKATTPLKILLLIAHAIAGQNSCFIWARDHRLHHKFSDTIADPHNANNGFFYSHMGWLLMKKHPEIIKRGREIDLSDLRSDPWVMFQYRYFLPIHFFFASIMTFAPYFLWGESIKCCIGLVYFVRYALTLHGAWAVNSVAHFFGTKPYSKHLRAVQVPWISFFGGGEGWHNYHHSFPWDYKAAEFETPFNFTRTFIEIAASMGLAYDLRSATQDMVNHRIKKHGDGTKQVNCEEQKQLEVDDMDLYGEKFSKFTTIRNRQIGS